MLYTNAWLRTLFVLFIALFGVSCSANDDNASLSASCEALSKSAKSIPDMVLVGTDVVDISAFERSSEQLTGNYSTDIGGAILSLSIKLSSSNKFVVQRKYQEPGEQVFESTYSSGCVINGYVYAENLTVKVVKEGILVLESKSNVDGIPMDLWILYNRVDK